MTSDPARDPGAQAALRELGCAGRDELAIGGIPARALAERFGTPLYVYDAAILRARLQAVRDAVGPGVAVLYSVKANPCLAVCRVLREAGAGAEVASAGELCIAEAAGFPAAELRFAGPGKTDAELDFALERGLGTFHVESADEVAALASLSRARGVRAGVAVRVNLDQQLESRQRMGGAGSRFGVDQAQVAALLQTIAGEGALDLRGLHVYGGSQCFDAESVAAHAGAFLERADAWERQLGLRLQELDLGGGFGVPTFVGDPEFDLDLAGERLRALMQQHGRPGRRFLVELGRFLAAPAGVFLARVVRAKTADGMPHATLDGGMNHCATAMGLGSVFRRPPRVVHATALRAPADAELEIGGPLCTPLDQIGGRVAFPELRRGDLVAVLNAGAYGLSLSPHGFLSHPLPAEVLVDGAEARLVRKRGTYADALAGQLP